MTVDITVKKPNGIVSLNECQPGDILCFSDVIETGRLYVYLSKNDNGVNYLDLKDGSKGMFPNLTAPDFYRVALTKVDATLRN